MDNQVIEREQNTMAYPLEDHPEKTDHDSDRSEERHRRKKERRHRRDKERRRHRRRAYKYHSSSSSCDDIVDDPRVRRKRRRKDKKERKSRHRSRSRRHAASSESEREVDGKSTGSDASAKAPVSLAVESTINMPIASTEGRNVSRDAQSERKEIARRMAPMSREEYEAKKTIVREVLDEETGRYRLVRGDGEIIERIVSRAQHVSINRQATRGDGQSFARSIYDAASRKR